MTVKPHLLYRVSDVKSVFFFFLKLSCPDCIYSTKAYQLSEWNFMTVLMEKKFMMPSRRSI